MARRKQWLAAQATALGILAAGFLSAPSSAGLPGVAPSAPSRSSAVTLITGDKVTVTPQGSLWDVQIQPVRRVGRTTDGFYRHAGPDRVTVIPSAALPLVKSGVLDKALFDVTEMIRQGLDDAHSKELPLLVRSTGGVAAARATASIGRVTRQLPGANLTAVSTAKDQATFAAITSSTAGKARLIGGLTKVWLNGRAKPTLDVSVPQVGAPAAWQAGYTGAGVKVAVLDTGYDAEHPDLAGIVKSEKNFIADDPVGMKDEVGHGTHVASTVAGRGVASGGEYTGVAKGAELLIGKSAIPAVAPSMRSSPACNGRRTAAHGW